MYDFLFVIIELFSRALTVETLQGKTCQTSLLLGEGGSLWAKISGEGVVPGEYLLVSTKLDTFCYLTVQAAPCYVTTCRRFDTKRCDRQTDRQTDGNAVASTALAMRALRRAVKTTHNLYIMSTAMCKLQKSPSMCCWLVSYSQGRNHVFKVGGPIFWSRLLYIEQNTDGIPRFVDCSLLRNGVITLFIKKVGVVRPNFGGSGSPPTLQWLRPWS